MKQQGHYDYIFTGLGASSCILIHELHRKGLLTQKKVLVLDPSNKTVNDKTYCFWSKDSDEITQDFSSLASHSWSKISIDNLPAQDIGDLKYYHINSLDLYNSAKKILADYKAIILKEAVLDIFSDHKTSVVSTSGKYTGESIFDARPPTVQETLPEDQNILQSFIGYKIKLKDETLNPDACTLMNFNVAQQGHTQFVYVLPFSENTALVELTRFGTEAISENGSKEILETYIKEHFGAYELTDIELGVIPMYMDLKSPKPIDGVVPIGTRANKVKPSTGYAFKNMHAHAKSICAEHSDNKTATRFRLYDRLLILILAVWPHQGKPIFQRLFRVRDTAYVLKFLDEKTTIWDDMKMFSKLPIAIFLRSCVALMMRKAKPAMFLFGPILLYFLLESFVPTVTEYVMYGVLIVGLILVGIPHGAMDHMTEALSKTKRITAPFVLKYLALMASVYLLWLFSPSFALMSFLLYSAWHFGETDTEEWGIRSPFIGMLWGVLFFVGLFSSHVSELQNVLLLLDAGSLNLSLNYSLIFAGAIGASFLLALLFKRIQWLVLVFFLFISQWVPLVISFGIYFIFHHSYKGWSHLKDSLGQNNFTLFKNALPFNAGAFILFLFFFLNPQGSLETNTSLFFVFISCISFPHIFCMHRFYALRKKG
jgi:lycopene beta-cyclase